MPAGFRRHFVGKTLINVSYCDSAIRFVGKSVIMMDISLNKLIQFYLNSLTDKFRHLSQHIKSFYTHKMAIVS